MIKYFINIIFNKILTKLLYKYICYKQSNKVKS